MEEWTYTLLGERNGSGVVVVAIAAGCHYAYTSTEREK